MASNIANNPMPDWTSTTVNGQLSLRYLLTINKSVTAIGGIDKSYNNTIVFTAW